jgi:hypothetical protein
LAFKTIEKIEIAKELKRGKRLIDREKYRMMRELTETKTISRKENQGVEEKIHLIYILKKLRSI